MKRIMIIKWCFVPSLLFLLFVSACATSQVSPYEMKKNKDADWNRYRSSDLQSVIEEHSNKIDQSKNVKMSINVQAANEPYVVEMVYSGEYRKISDNKKQLITVWGKSVQIEERFFNMFEDEILFKHGSNDFWLPVQGPLFPYFKKELKKGEAINLYVMFIGTVWESDQMQWVFIVNEFKKKP